MKRTNLNKIRLIDTLYGQHSRWGIYDKKSVSPTLCASMGEGGGHVPLMVKRIDYGKTE